MESRVIVSRDIAPPARRAFRHPLRSAPLVALVGGAIELPPTIGSDCDSWIDRAKEDAARCLQATNISQNVVARGCGVDANGHAMRGPCGSLLREVALGGANAVAIPAGGSGLIRIPIEANFKPLMIQVDPGQLTTRGGARLTSVKYGPTSKLINQFVLLAQSDVTSTTGGYRLPHDIFLTAGQFVDLIVFIPATATPFAIDELVLNVFGFTDAP